MIIFKNDDWIADNQCSCLQCSKQHPALLFIVVTDIRMNLRGCYVAWLRSISPCLPSVPCLWFARNWRVVETSNL